MKCLKIIVLVFPFFLWVPMMRGYGTVEILNELNGYGLRWDLRTEGTFGLANENKNDRWVDVGPGTTDKYSVSTVMLFLKNITLYWMAKDGKTKEYFRKIDISASKDGYWVFICMDKGIRSLHIAGTSLHRLELQWKSKAQ